MPTYAVYGIRFASPLRFPELRETRAAPDATLSLGRMEAGRGPSRPNWYRATPTEASMGLEGIGAVRVRDGREILVDPERDVEEARLRNLLLGPVFSLLLLQRGLFPLHASAVAIGGRAIALSAPSGGGKSTTAAALFDAGHGLLADDVAVIRLDSGGAEILPGYPQLKLTLDSLRRLGRSPEDCPPLHSMEDRRALRVERAFREEPVPLARIYVLEGGPDRSIERMQPQEAFPILVSNCHRLELLRNALGPTALMDRCARVAGAVPLFRVRIDFTIDSPRILARRIEEHALS